MIRLPTFVVLLSIAAAAGCGDDNGITAPTAGTLEITTSTTGDPGTELSVIVDGASPRGIDANGTLTIPDMATGTHLVQLTLPTSCSFEGENPRTVQVTQGATATVAFVITCG